MLQPPRRPAFTLVELLVVIAVIALLAALVMPALRRSRELALVTTMNSNVRQIQLACDMYMGSNSDYLAPIERMEVPEKQPWGFFQEMALPVLVSKNFLDDQVQASAQAIINSVGNAPGFVTDPNVNVQTVGLAKNSTVLHDLFYDPANPGPSGGGLYPVFGGPFGQNRGSVWLPVFPDKQYRWHPDVKAAIGWRGTDGAWDADYFSQRGFISEKSGEGGDQWLLLKDSGQWEWLDDAILK